MTNHLQAACQVYDPKHWTLIPLRPKSKAPQDFEWTTRKYDTRESLAYCIKHERNAGVRLTAEQLVIDVDPRNGGAEGFAALCSDLKIDLSAFPRVRTGADGFHYYMAKPADVPVLDTLEATAYQGIEFKSKGRQVVAAGSLHPDTGKPYKWEVPLGTHLPMVPDGLLNLIRRPQTSALTDGGQYTQEQLARALSALDPSNFREHEKWFTLMAAAHHATNGDGRSEFVEWSASDPLYVDHGEIVGRRWDSLHRERPQGKVATYRTLNKFLSDAGKASAQAPGDTTDDFNGDVEGKYDFDTPALVEGRGLTVRSRDSVAPDTFENAMGALRRAGLEPAWNALKQQVEFLGEVPWDEKIHGRILTDNLARIVRVYLINRFQGFAYEPGKENLFEGIMTVALSKTFNPVLDYLNSLKWDGKSRVAGLFANYFQCKDSPYARAVARCSLVGAVRRMRHPGCKYDTMTALKGEQGLGKSKSIRKLFHDQWFSDAALGDLHSKDSAMLLRGIWVHEFAEIDSLTRPEANTLKAFLSKQSDRQRDPYGRIVEDKPRYCTFWATINEGGFLRDASGARRFWTLDVLKPIDVDRIIADRDQIWAEAAVLEAKGEPDVLPRALWAEAAERAANETADDPWADALQSFLSCRQQPEFEGDDISPRLPPDRVHTSELFTALGMGVKEQTVGQAQRLRTVMEQRLKWKHKRVVRVLGRVGCGYVRGL